MIETPRESTEVGIHSQGRRVSLGGWASLTGSAVGSDATDVGSEVERVIRSIGTRLADPTASLLTSSAALPATRVL